MVITVTLNPAIDRMVEVRQLRPGRLVRMEQGTSRPGGQGINTAIMLHVFGDDATAMGFVGGGSGRYLEEEVRRHGIATGFVHLEGDTRTNYIILDTSKNSSTQLNERGPFVSEQDKEDLAERFEALLGQATMVVIGGSLPQNVEPAYVAKLARRAAVRDVPVILSSTESVMAEALFTRPFLVQPDTRTTDRVAGYRLTSERSRQQAADALIKQGAHAVALTHDKITKTVVTPEAVFEGEARQPFAVRGIAASDAFLAGLIHEHLESGSMFEAVKLGMAASIAVAERFGNVVESREDVMAALSQVEAREVPHSRA